MTTTDSDLPDAEYLRRLLRVELVDARKKAEMTQKDVADKLAWSVSKAVRMENGVVSVAPSDVRAMLSLFGEEEQRIEELVSLAVQARDAKSWAEYGDLLTPTYKELIGQEARAASITKYEPNVVPGLFQTNSYAMALMEALGIDAAKATKLAEVRSRRQAVLDLAGGPDFNVVIGEIALVRKVGSSRVMEEQIEHLVKLSERRQINLFLLPFSVGAHPGMGVPFTVLQFSDAKLDDILYLEDGMKRSTSSEEDEVVLHHLETFRIIEERAENSGTFTAHAERILHEVYGAEHAPA